MKPLHRLPPIRQRLLACQALIVARRPLERQPQLASETVARLECTKHASGANSGGQVTLPKPRSGRNTSRLWSPRPRGNDCEIHRVNVALQRGFEMNAALELQCLHACRRNPPLSPPNAELPHCFELRKLLCRESFEARPCTFVARLRRPPAMRRCAGLPDSLYEMPAEATPAIAAQAG